MKAPSPFLYIGLESKEREFEAKLLLAAAAAERGMIAVFGQHVLLNRAVSGLVPGTFLVKGLNRVQVDALRHAAGRHLVAAINEEMLGIAEPDLMLRDHDPDASTHCDLVFAQGDVHAAMLTARAGFTPDRVFVTGNPRIDLLRKPFSRSIIPDAERLSARFGRFVLVNTNACAVNPAVGTLEAYFNVCVEIGWLDPNNAADVAEWRAHVEHDRLNDAALAETVRLLARALPEHAIVVRPHPSEDFEAWRLRFEAVEGDDVVREGSHLSWMMAADAVLHTSCTSGVEAEVLGRPAVSLVPEGAPVEHWFLSNRVNRIARSPAMATEMISALVAGRAVPPEDETRRMALARHLTLDGQGFAFDRIADVIAGHVADPRHLIRRIDWKPMVMSEVPERSDHARAKFSLDVGEVRDRLAAVAGLTGRFDGLELIEVWESLFVIARRGRLRLPDDGKVFRLAG